jgi:CheY-like chemotaxis protein
LINLVGNALKFTERGEVVVTVEVVERKADAVRLRLAVRNTGIGMGPETMVRLFQPFTQAHTSTTRRFGGTGLGLAICRHIVETMGGRIGVRSEPGVGSTFHFEAVFGLAGDAVQVRRRPGGAQAASLAPIRGARVLLVEDNAINQQVAKELLTQAGLHVTVAGDGAQALQRLEAESFDVVLMDLQMPVMDGYTAVRRLRENPRWHDLPVLAMTANVMAEDRARVAAAGMNAHLGKPIVQADLHGALLRWVPPRRDTEPGVAMAASSDGSAGSSGSSGSAGAAEAGLADPAPEEMAAVPTAGLPETLDGIDLPRALAGVGGHVTLLRRLLAELHTDHAKDAAALRQALAMGRRD